ncbi:MAG: deoxyribodipyrimidine photo-lyase, partial [Planctomycetaceae bacterium]|nr:deoxyribodipyrimidine photo-lyase [Planctomycetaceae bacterium]
APADFPASDSLDDWKLLPKIPWDAGLVEAWTPGEEAASKLLKDFLKKSVGGYRENRNLPAISGTSRLSPYLHFGEISPRTISHQTIAQIEKFEQQDQQEQIENAEVFLSEIGWREFACSILFHFPHTVKEPLRNQFRDFTWTRNSKWLKAWQRGKTGFPIVDAGMRELWHTGWMHNRVRMIVASFLTKDLQIHWLEGANWFMDTLVDADLASNTLGWQWTAGCGADAAPYFRIFNPVLQSEKFDAEGDYIRQWCPELAKLPDRWIHKPDQAPPNVLRDAGVQLGKTYPKPIVDHSEQRKLALERYDDIRNVSK